MTSLTKHKEGEGVPASSFTQGYIDELLKSLDRVARCPVCFGSGVVVRYKRPPMSVSCGQCAGTGKVPARLSDLAPETRARIIADCASYQERYPDAVTAEQARAFWRNRNANSLANWFAIRWPRVAPYLGEDGRVYLRETP